MTQPNQMLGLKEVAELLGVKHTSANVYHQNAKRKRRDGQSQRQDMPEPDLVIGNRPAWKRRTIERWIPKRGTTPN